MCNLSEKDFAVELKIDEKIVKPLQREKCPYSEFSWFVFSCIRTECGKIRTRKTPNTDTFHAVRETFVL